MSALLAAITGRLWAARPLWQGVSRVRHRGAGPCPPDSAHRRAGAARALVRRNHLRHSGRISGRAARWLALAETPGEEAVPARRAIGAPMALRPGPLMARWGSESRAETNHCRTG